MSDGTIQSRNITWTPATADTSVIGEQVFVGKVDRYDQNVTLTLKLTPVPLTVKAVSDISNEIYANDAYK